MMMNTPVDADGTAFICPECSFNGKSLPELISHLNEAHSEETAIKSEAPPKIPVSITQPEKRSRRKPAFSHQIVSQAPRPTSTLFNQRSSSNTESESNELWNRSSTSDKTSTAFLSTLTDDSSLSMISDENTNINLNSKQLTPTINNMAKRNPNVLHSILSQQRPIAPKNGSPTSMKITPASSPSILPMINSSPGTDNSFFSPTNHSIQPYRKNFQCRMCRLTYKNFHDCTAHIRKKHEISHAQAGRYVEKLDTDAPLPPSATGNYKFRVKGGKSLSAQSKIFQCKYCLFTSPWSKDISRHQRDIHPNYPPHILQKDYAEHDQEVNNNLEEQHDSNESLSSSFLIDPVQAFGEVINTTHDEVNENEEETDDEENSNDHDDDDNNDDDDDDEEEESEMMMTDTIDDDEEDALWKYQQEINQLSESDISLINNNNINSTYALARRFKKFRCPHCEHSAPTLTKLKLHVATHINIKPFMCSICGWRANLRWYIQCHAKKRHPNQNLEILQLSPEEAEQTIDAYMKERGIENKLSNGQDSKRRYQCSLCQFRSNHPKFLEQHIAQNHPTKTTKKPNEQDEKLYSKFLIKSSNKSNHSDEQNKSQTLYNRSSLIQSDGTILLPDPSQIVYPNFSSHPNFNPNRLFYCALCYRGYRWRYDVKRHHKTMHETPEDEAALGLSMSPKSVKCRNKEFNRNFRYLEYVPQFDGLISASMSSVNNHNNHHQQQHHHHRQSLFSMKNENHFEHEKKLDDENDESHMDDDLKLSIADARTVDVTEDEAAALLMIEPYKSSDQSSILVHDHSEESAIVFDDDRQNYSHHQNKDKSPEILRNSQRTSSGFKPYRCPYCFYRTNWRTDSLRHIRARHKIEPTQDGYYEMTPEEAESTYAEYERTFGFVVSKKVLGRFTEFRHLEWKDLQRSIWEKIKDKQGFEQIIYERLRPDNNNNNTDLLRINPIDTSIKPMITLNKHMNRNLTNVKRKRMFTCMECAFRSYKLMELDKHICSKYQKSQQSKVHGKCFVSIYQCTTCSYRTIERNYARKHISLHRLKQKLTARFYYCSFCGYNHRRRDRITLHITKQHSGQSTSLLTRSFQSNIDADFTLKQILLHRSFIQRQINNQNSLQSRIFYCQQCPQISTSILEHNHHQTCHEQNSNSKYKCNHCSFASNSSLYTNQHNLLHSKSNRLLTNNYDTENLKKIAVSTIFKETLGKNRRYHCPFCGTFSSSTSSSVLDHIKNIHTGNSSQFNDNLIIGSDMAKEILALETVTNNQRMDTS